MNNIKDVVKKIDRIKEKVDFCSCVPEFNIAACCRKHDDDYINCGKFRADFDFLKCGLIKAKTYSIPHRIIFTYIVAITYYIGVTLFGWWPYYKAQIKKN